MVTEGENKNTGIIMLQEYKSFHYIKCWHVHLNFTPSVEHQVLVCGLWVWPPPTTPYQRSITTARTCSAISLWLVWLSSCRMNIYSLLVLITVKCYVNGSFDFSKSESNQSAIYKYKYIFIYNINPNIIIVKGWHQSSR